MRVTPPPVALPVAAAAIPLLAAALVPLAAPSTALAERWLRPVPGEVARTFHYTPAAPFARGAHRGVDLAAPPGTAVRAACGGVVVHAGPVAGRDGVVSVRCGRRRVSYLPVAAVRVRAGGTVRAGTPLGTVAPGHGGLHLGVRREGDPFGYEDPAALLAGFEPPAAPVTPPHARRIAPRPIAPDARRVAPRPIGPRLAAPSSAPRPIGPRLATPRAPGPVDRRVTVPRSIGARFASPPGAAAIAPWPVWLGLALLLSGAAGSGTVVLRRRRRSAAPNGGAVAAPVLEPVR